MTAAQWAAGEFGSVPRSLVAGLNATSDDAQLSVSWVVVAPALTDREADLLARSVFAADGEAARPVATGVDSDVDAGSRIGSVAYRFVDGEFVVIWAWSDDGGVVTLTSGRGVSTTDEQVAELERASRALLAGEPSR